MPTRLFKVLSVALAGVMITLSSANAASVSYFLDQTNDTGLPSGVNWATVTIADGVGGDIDFTVEVNTSAFPVPLSNFGMQRFFFNYDDALTVSETNIINLNPSDWDIREDRNAGGGFGFFDFDFKGNGNSRTEVLTFSITGVSGDSIFSYALGNADETGEFFAAHIAGYDDGVSGNTSGKFAGSTLVPIPAAVWLFGSALGLLGWSRRRS